MEVDVAFYELFWWVCVGVMIVIELISGTFYLLIIALGFVAAGLAYQLGAQVEVQVALAVAIAFVALIKLRFSRFGQRRRHKDIAYNRDVNIDIGALLHVVDWQNYRARTTYRGTWWDVELTPGEPEDARFYEVTAVRGNCLLVAAKKHTVVI